MHAILGKLRFGMAGSKLVRETGVHLVPRVLPLVRKATAEGIKSQEEEEEEDDWVQFSLLKCYCKNRNTFPFYILHFMFSCCRAYVNSS
jgi:hypothetical protein